MSATLKITQTFWTANKSLLENGFGWPHPQYHLMSWALSCLSLRKNYENVVLYTDSNGYKVFIGLLQLPYTEVVVQYDGLRCPDILCDRIAEWKELPNETLYDWEQRLSSYSRFINAGREQQAVCRVGKNPYASVFEIPSHWPDLAKHLLKERVNRERCGRNADVVCVPCLLGEGYREALLSDWGYNILALLESEMGFEELLAEIRSTLSPEIRDNGEGVYRSMLAELEYLCYNGIVYVKLESEK